jgi:hypothetical protein
MPCARQKGRISSVESLKELTSKQQADACSALEQSVEEAILALTQTQDTMQEDGEDTMMMKLVGVPNNTVISPPCNGLTNTHVSSLQGEVLQALQGAALVAHGLLQVCHSRPPESLLNAATLLHDNCILVSAPCYKQCGHAFNMIDSRRLH